MRKEYSVISELMADIISVSLKLYDAYLTQEGIAPPVCRGIGLRELIGKIDAYLQSEADAARPSVSGFVYSRELTSECMLNRPFLAGGVTVDFIRKVLRMLHEAAPDVMRLYFRDGPEKLDRYLNAELSCLRCFHKWKGEEKQQSENNDWPYTICRKAFAGNWNRIRNFGYCTNDSKRSNRNSLMYAFLLFSVTLEWLARNTSEHPASCEPHLLLTWLLEVSQLDIRPGAEHWLAQEEGVLTVASMLAIFRICDPQQNEAGQAVLAATGRDGTAAVFFQALEQRFCILPAFIEQTFHLNNGLRLRYIGDAHGYNALKLPKQFVMPNFYMGEKAVETNVPLCTQDPQTLHLLLSPTGYGKSSFVKAAMTTALYAWMQPWQWYGIEDGDWYTGQQKKIWRSDDRDAIPMPLLITGLPYGRLPSLENAERDLIDDAIDQYAAAFAAEKEDVKKAWRKLRDDEKALLKAALMPLAEAGRLIVIVDAYDEALERKLLGRRILGFRAKYPGCKVVVTGRPLYRGAYSDLQRARYAELAIDFTDKDIDALVDLWHEVTEDSPEDMRTEAEEDKKALRASRFTREMRTPYLVTMMLYFRNAKGVFSIGRMYEEITKDILKKMYRQSPDGSTPSRFLEKTSPAKLRRDLFGPLALNCVVSDQVTVDMREIKEMVKQNAGNLLAEEAGPMETEAFKALWSDIHRFILTQPGLLVATDDDKFCWLTKGLMYYLAAEQLLDPMINGKTTEESKKALSCVKEWGNNHLYDLTVTLCYLIAYTDQGNNSQCDRDVLIPHIVQDMIRFTFADGDSCEERCSLCLECCNVLLDKDMYGPTDLNAVNTKHASIAASRRYLEIVRSGLIGQGVCLPEEKK